MRITYSHWRHGKSTTGWIFILLFACLLSEYTDVSAASRIQLQISTVMSNYAIGETVLLRMELTNAGSEPLHLLLAYPTNLGLTFLCKDQDAISRYEMHTTERIPMLSLDPGKSFRANFALNRYLEFTKPKQYVINYRAEFLKPISSTNESVQAEFAEGQILVTIRAGLPTKEHLEVIKSAAVQDDPQALLEAVESLLWINDPSIVGLLEELANKLPSVRPEIVGALRKFANTSQGRSALWNLALTGDAEVLNDVLRISAEGKLPLSLDTLSEVLKSGDHAKRIVALQYLAVHGDAKCLPILKSFLDDKDSEVARLAREITSKLSP